MLVANYLADIFTLSTSLAGLPGMSIPVGFGQGEKGDPWHTSGQQKSRQRGNEYAYIYDDEWQTMQADSSYKVKVT